MPTGNWVVNDSGPNEHEHDAGQHSPALCNRASGESDSDCRKHSLIDRKEQIWDPRAANARRGKDISEADVLQVTDEEARLMRKGKTVTPEEPLERRDSGGHDRKPYQ